MQALLVIAAALAITMESMDDDNTDASDEGEQLFQLVKPSAHKSTASGMMSHGKGWCADSASWCETWTCDGSPWCQGGKRPEACEHCCPSWCGSWSCSGEAWCKESGKRPPVCEGCCPKWPHSLCPVSQIHRRASCCSL